MVGKVVPRRNAFLATSCWNAMKKPKNGFPTWQETTRPSHIDRLADELRVELIQVGMEMEDSRGELCRRRHHRRLVVGRLVVRRLGRGAV